jgi:hypothetical protein
VTKSLLFPMVATALIAFALAAGFAAQQSLWVDETTQLAGIRVPIGDTFKFLTGHPAPAFDRVDVPGDRMPPLSYLVGKAWAIIFGFSETSLRYLGVTLFSITTALTAAAAGYACRPSSDNARAQLAAWLSGLAMATAPTCVALAPEIRAYPLFHCLSAAATLLLVLRLTSPARWQLPALIAVLTAAVYTHYFGVILTGAVFVALFVGQLRLRQPIRPALILASSVAVLSLGLIPFLKQAVALSHQQPGLESGRSFAAIVQLWVRFGAHGATQTINKLEYLAVGAFSLCVVPALVRSARSRVHPAALPLVALHCSGLLVVGVASLCVRGFNAANVTYNVWAIPPLFVILGFGLAQIPNVSYRRIALAVVGIWLMTTIYTSIFLSVRGSLFAHGSNPAIVNAIETIGADQVTVIHTGDKSGIFGMAYYPLRYNYLDRLQQYGMYPGGPLVDARLGRPGTELAPTGLKTPFVLLVYTREFRSEELARLWKTSSDLTFDDSACVAAIVNAGYRVVHRKIAPSFLGSEIILLARPGALENVP